MKSLQINNHMAKLPNFNNINKNKNRESAKRLAFNNVMSKTTIPKIVVPPALTTPVNILPPGAIRR
jgi:hypothetical protein